jgi:dethiobiotin synthetase
MVKGFFITGTDTAVGKTIVAGAMVKALNALGLRTAAMKPIETGCRNEGGILVPNDGLFLRHIAGIDEPVTSVTPCCLESPLAPMAAAEIEGADVSVKEIKKAFFAMSAKYDAVVVEGIGGLMVPIRKDYYVAELVADLGLPLLIVTRPGLGTINQTMLTLNHALRVGLKVAGIVINYSSPPENSLAEKTNPGVLSRIAAVPLIGTFPYLREISEDIIGETALNNLDLEVIRKFVETR